MQLFKVRFGPALYWPLAIGLALIATTFVCVGKVSLILPAIVIAGLGMVAVTVSPTHLFEFYLVYLMFEGAAKIWTNYHPIVHVGSDLLLIFASFRLFSMMRRRGMSHSEDPNVESAYKWIFLFLIFYWMWVVLQFINPSALGLLPSIAGLKLHVVPMLGFLIVTYVLNKEEAKRLPYLLLILGLSQSLISVIDWQMGPYFLGRLNPSYLAVYQDFLRGAPYRPFGTTHLPGAPSAWITQTVIAALIVRHLEGKTPSVGSRWWKYLVMVYIPVGIFALVACQVRVNLIRFILTAIFGMLLLGRRHAIAALIIGSLAVLYLAKTKKANTHVEDLNHYESASGKIGQALSRVGTLKSIDTFKRARGGTWAFDEFRRRSQETMMGIGLSRISASSRPWTAWAAKDRIFSSRWGFVDNLYLGIFSEVGIGGLLSYLALAAILIQHLFNRATYVSRLVAFGTVISLLGGYASESLLYQPDASLFWLYAALGLKVGNHAKPKNIQPASPNLSGISPGLSRIPRYI